MALVTQDVVPPRLYSPFEGLSEAQRMWSSVPRGLVRFFSDEALDAKPVNDDLKLSFTCSLPPGFAYVFSALNFQLVVDKADDFFDFVRLRILNGIPNGPGGNEMVGSAALRDWLPGASIFATGRILTFDQGDLRSMFPQPIVSNVAAGATFIFNAANGSNTVQAAGTMDFLASFYQYELNQAVRFPLNAPVPVAIR